MVTWELHKIMPVRCGTEQDTQNKTKTNTNRTKINNINSLIN